ncbi:MAG: proton-conducting transporter membrane subunit [Thermodesulfobacteriota bacterium]
MIRSSATLCYELAAILFCLGLLLPLLPWRNNRLANLSGAGAAALACGAGLAGAVAGLLRGDAQEYRFAWPAAGMEMVLRTDGLAHFFLAPLFLLALAAALYGHRYLSPPARGLQAGRHWLAFNLLVASMAAVIVAADSLLFLTAWELMSLSSFLLVVQDLGDEQSRRAGWIFLAATHLGTTLLFAMFFQAYRLTGTMDFAAFASLGSRGPATVLLFFTAALIGFGTKAGLFPLHGWLPDAHGAAPSHVSALMSGVMIKTAVYAFLRLAGQLQPLPGWCGLAVAVLGLTGALFGIAMAVVQTDLKRSLAYSTVENIGIVFLALGGWLYCRSAGLAGAAALLLSGGLLHVWNHALFKGLLFLAAGSVLHATGSREMSSIGGLLRRMPITGGLMVLGGAAIAALPPLNGLIGEVCIYLGLLEAGQSSPGGMAFVFMLLVVLLAMTGGLVLLAVSRILGIVLAGEPRTRAALAAHEAPAAMLAGMALPALFCLLIGIAPQLVLSAVTAPLAVLAPTASAALAAAGLPFGPAWTTIAAVPLLVLLAALFRRHRQRDALASAATWGCGFGGPARRMAYTAGGFAQFIQDEVYCASLRPALTGTTAPSLFPGMTRLVQRSVDPVLHRLLTPLFARVAGFAQSCRMLQSGQLGIYMGYFFLATTLLLGWAVFSFQG